MHHLHDLHHVQVNGFLGPLANSQHCIHHHLLHTNTLNLSQSAKHLRSNQHYRSEMGKATAYQVGGSSCSQTSIKPLLGSYKGPRNETSRLADRQQVNAGCVTQYKIHDDAHTTPCVPDTIHVITCNLTHFQFLLTYRAGLPSMQNRNRSGDKATHTVTPSPLLGCPPLWH